MADLILYVILAILIAVLFGIKKVLTLERRIYELEGGRRRSIIPKPAKKRRKR